MHGGKMSGLCDMSVEIGGLKLKNPVLAASGTFGYAREMSELMDVEGLGGVIVKSVTAERREGNGPRRLLETAAGILNTIGLQNCGVEDFLRDELPFLSTLPVPVLVSVAGSTIEEYEAVCGRLAGAKGVSGIELNVSCPNVKRGGMQFGTDPAAAKEITKRARKLVGKLLIVKLSPNVTDIAAVASAVEEAGADAISAVNTFLGMGIDTKRRLPSLSSGFGGLSGPAIKPLALRCVWQVAQAVRIPVIGVGGIVTGLDAAEFILAGASAVAVGTANFLNPKAGILIATGLREYAVKCGCSSIASLVGAARKGAG